MTVVRHYCTYFDHRFLGRGLALYDSLTRHGTPFRLWVLCLSDECRRELDAMALPALEAVPLDELEGADPELHAVKSSRTVVEYYFSLTAAWILHVFRRDAAADPVTYLDADLFFFSSPEPLFEELGRGSVSIIPHRFPQDRSEYLKNGIYNVGWLSFRRDEAGMACLSWWRERCIEWCFDRHEDGKYADQKYLDDWPERFAGVRVLQHLGANAAPWNIASLPVTVRDGTVCIGPDPLVFFHFHGLKEIRKGLFDLNLVPYGVRADEVLIRHVYRPYLDALARNPHIQAGSARLRAKSIGAWVRQMPRLARRELNVLLGRYYRYEPGAGD